MERKRITKRVKLGSNWLSILDDFHIVFSLEESKAIRFTHAEDHELHEILANEHGLENYKIIESYE